MCILLNSNHGPILINWDDVSAIGVVKDESYLDLCYKDGEHKHPLYNSPEEALAEFNRIVERLKELNQL